MMMSGLASLIDAPFFPQRCALCGSLLDPMEYLPVCTACLRKIRERPAVSCLRCSGPVSEKGLMCSRCRSADFLFSYNYSLFLYEEYARELIDLYKYGNEKRISLLFADLVYRIYCLHFFPRTVIPVPYRRKKKKRLGWDHVDEIASILEKRYKVPVKRVLRRGKSLPQKSLSYAERLVQLKGKIEMKKGGGSPASVVLFDDVFTTGATVNECTRVLLEGGVRDVTAMTLVIDV